LEDGNYSGLIEGKDQAAITILANSMVSEASEIQTDWKMGFLDLQILSLLSTFPMTGYCLRKNLHFRFGTWISFGTLYPHLKLLEKIRVLSSSSKSRTPTSAEVITYELTVKGRGDLRRGLRTYQRSIKIVEELAGALRE
jgi:DNA-binding PadR family transcriptional regulator